MTPGFVVATMKNFKGLAELLESVDIPIYLQVMNNWDRNRGCSIPWNEGIKKCYNAGCKHVFVFNDDVILEPGTLQKLIDATRRDRYITSILNTRDATPATEESYSPSPDFSGICMSRKSIEDVGLFDPEIHSYFNDNDLVWRVHLAGKWAGARLDAPALHKGSVTQFWDGTDRRVVSHQAFDAAREYYVRKWAGTPGEEKNRTAFGG